MHGNPHLARSLRARWARWRPSWTKDDGLVLPARRRPTRSSCWRASFPAARSYSPTALQTFAACPYRFVLHAIHRLRPREDRTSPEQLDPLTRGSLFHETQFAFFGEVRAAVAAAAASRLRERAPRHRRSRARRASPDRYEEELAPAIPRIWKSEIESLRIDLRGWIRKLLEDDVGLRAVALRVRVRARRVRPRRARSGLDAASRRWFSAAASCAARSIWSSATGGGARCASPITRPAARRARRESCIGGGELLQPVLYALAAEALLAGEGERVDSGRLFYCTQRGGYLEIDVPLDDRSRGAAQQVLTTVEDAVERGFLPAAPREGACDWCDYRAVCGPYEELRVGKKKQADLAAA